MLLEDTGYKRSIREGDVLGLLKAFTGSGSDGNPLKGKGKATGAGGYESMNRDSGGSTLPRSRVLWYL